MLASLTALGGAVFATRAIRDAGKEARFTISVTPARQSAVRGGAATFSVRLGRAGSFTHTTELRVAGLPRGVRPRWQLADGTRSRVVGVAETGAILTLRTSARTPLGTRRVKVFAVTAGATRTRELTLTVKRPGARRFSPRVSPTGQIVPVEGRPVPVGGDLPTPLYPGGGAPLDLVLANPHPFDIRVTALNVSVGADTTSPHCRGRANYEVTQYSGGYPLLLHPGSTRLSALVSSSSGWPKVSMHNLPINQDACRGAVLTFDYAVRADR